MIPQPQTAKELKEKFLETNRKYKLLQETNATEFCGSNDEVWIMQCPKGTDISQLQGQKLKLPGRSNQDTLESVAVEYPEPMPQAFGYINQKGRNSIKIVPIQGSIILRSRLKAIVPPEVESETPSSRVPMPTAIKMRHPLHGVDYESKITISPEIASRLKLADEVASTSTSSKKVKKSKTKEPKSIAIDSEGEVEVVIQKSAKKKKRKKSVEEDVEIVSPKKKKKKNSFNGDIAEDLQWIQKL